MVNGFTLKNSDRKSYCAPHLHTYRPEQVHPAALEISVMREMDNEEERRFSSEVLFLRTQVGSFYMFCSNVQQKERQVFNTFFSLLISCVLYISTVILTFICGDKIALSLLNVDRRVCGSLIRHPAIYTLQQSHVTKFCAFNIPIYT